MRLSKYEQETIILFNEGEETAHIYTFNSNLKKRLADFAQRYPDLCHLEKSCKYGSETYVLDKSRISIRLQPPYTEERKQKIRTYAKKYGLGRK